MKKILMVIFSMFLFCVSSVSAEFYRYTDPHGNVIYTDDLSNVPETQREKATMYEESVTPPSPPEQTVKEAAEKPPGPSDEEISALNEKGQRLRARKSSLDQEYDALAKENAQLKAEQDEAVTPDQIRSVNQKVVGFNTRFKAYQEKSAALEAEVQAHNEKVKALDPKKHAEQDTEKR